MQRKNEYRIDSLKVISDSFRLSSGRKCLYGFFATQFIVWDNDMDAEVWNVHSAGWKRPWAFHVDPLSGRFLFCYSSGCGDLHIHEKNILHNGPHCLVSGGHGREINCAVDLGHGVLLTAGADATLNMSTWHQKNDRNVLISECFSKQPFGTTTRMLKTLHNVDESIIVSGGARTVMTAWRYRNQRIQNMSIFADPVVCKIKRVEKKMADSRVLCFTLIPSLTHHIVVVSALSNSDVEVRSIPSRVDNEDMVHDWPLLAVLKAQESMIRYPLLSLDHYQGCIYGGNTNGDVLIWDITCCLDVKATIFELRPIQMIKSFHSCGVNALSLKAVVSGDTSYVSVITGGDDQALGLLCLDPVSQFKLNQQCLVPNAHTSSIRDLCVHKNTIFSIGLDQYLRRWNMKISTGKIQLHEISAVHLQVLEPSSISISESSGDDGKFSITVVGRGIETFLL